VSIISIRAALEQAVDSIAPSIATAWENVEYKPIDGVPYQRVYIIYADPNNQEFGSNYQELGMLSINLYYPNKTGANALEQRIELIRQKFARGATFSSGGIDVIINRTPAVGPSFSEDGRYLRNVSARFYVNINL
jgi:hypothetical protein